MANTRLVLMVALGLLAGGLFLSAAPASADTSADYYKSSMYGLIQDTDAYAAEVKAEIGAVTVKPERACGAEFQTILRRGGWLADDLTGSAVSAPDALKEANEKAAAGFQQMVDGAEVIALSCDGSTLTTGAEMIEAGHDEYMDHIQELRTFVNRAGGSNDVPLLPKPITPEFGF